ncbi:MAG: SLC13 family permease [Alphaproteobacteria bacterium]|nr:MAG: SLC13 family permease [Alphaproteobacteria bacterium]
MDQQILALAIIVAMMALFAWGRLRYDLVAVISLVAAFAAGIVPAEKAFSGFSSDIVIIVASALVLSAAVSRSGIVDLAMSHATFDLSKPRSQIVTLTSSIALLSGFVKNIGTLAMFLPIAFKIARRSNTSPSLLLMPMSFAALLGGLITLVGTSPNIIVSQAREKLLGMPFRMFDFAPVGIGLTVAGIAFLAFGYRLLPTGRRATASIEAAFNLDAYATEVTVPQDSPLVGQSITDLEKQAEDEIDTALLIRGGLNKSKPAKNTKIRADDLLILHGEPAALERAVAVGKLVLVRHDKTPSKESASDEIGVMEAVVGNESPLIGRTVSQNQLFDRYDLNLLAVSRRGSRITHRLNSVRLRPGDAIVLQGNMRFMPETLGELACLPLAERALGFGRARNTYLPITILATAMLLVALGVVPVAIGFFVAAVLVILTDCITLREAYGAVDWPILIMLGALIPVSDAAQSTGLTASIAGIIALLADILPRWGYVPILLLVGMCVTPFLNNAATVLILAPIAVSLATSLKMNADPLLMAVAIGAGCDFLTPIGHQCNTLVMGPGGYRFGDYWRLGLPLSFIVLLTGVPLILLFWPP